MKTPLKYSIDINKKVNIGDGVVYTYLIFAVSSGNLDLAKYLVEKGANVNLSNGSRAEELTPLTAAARADRREIIEYLLSKKAKIDSPDKQMMTPLMLALFNGKYGSAKFLIEKKANLGGADIAGNTTLMLAVLSGNIECVKLVLEKKDVINKTIINKQ